MFRSGHAGLAVAWKAEVSGVGDLGESLPVAHSLDDVVVSVDLSVDTFLPSAVDTAVVTARIGVVGGGIGHGFGAAVAVRANAGLAITLSIGDTHGTIVHQGVRGEHELDLPVAIGAAEKLDLEVSMLGDVLLADQNTAGVAHVSGGGAWVLIIVAVELCDESF